MREIKANVDHAMDQIFEFSGDNQNLTVRNLPDWNFRSRLRVSTKGMLI